MNAPDAFMRSGWQARIMRETHRINDQIDDFLKDPGSESQTRPFTGYHLIIVPILHLQMKRHKCIAHIVW
jgi:hypothetical protein